MDYQGMNLIEPNKLKYGSENISLGGGGVASVTLPIT